MNKKLHKKILLTLMVLIISTVMLELGFAHNRWKCHFNKWTSAVFGVVYIKIAPPAIRFEIKPPRPCGRAVWIPGHWDWKGRKYLWVNGHWNKKPKSQHWVPGQWKHKRHGWVWIRGHWK